MLTRIRIFAGRLCLQGTSLEWQLSNARGEPVTFDYRGEAFTEAERVCVAQGTAVYEYRISDAPTSASVDRQAGWDKARSQKRRIEPKGVSSEFYQAWAECWRYRRGIDAEYAPMEFSYSGCAP